MFSTGFLARGLAEIGPRWGLEGWRWIPIIEGLLGSLSFANNWTESNTGVQHRRLYVDF